MKAGNVKKVNDAVNGYSVEGEVEEAGTLGNDARCDWMQVRMAE